MLAILATHPIQYHVPLWQRLAASKRVPFEVWYLTAHGAGPSRDEGFGRVVNWDLDMLGGYAARFSAEPVARNPGAFWDVRLGSTYRQALATGAVRAVLVTGWNVFAFWQAVVSAHRSGVAVWMRGDSNDLKRDAAVKRLGKRPILNVLFRRIDRFLCVGAANRRLYEGYGIGPSRLAWTPHAVDNARFRAQASALSTERQRLRAEWGIPSHAFCLLFAGKFVPEKRPMDILEALVRTQVSGTAGGCHALFVGSGDLGAALRERCAVAFDAERPAAGLRATPGGKPRASFTGFLNQRDISRAYVAADGLVLPSARETWGLVVNEALASGLPCIVSDQCGCAEDLITPLDPTLVFPAGDVEALARAIVRLAKHPPRSDRMESHIAKFDLAVSVDTIERLWEEAAWIHPSRYGADSNRGTSVHRRDTRWSPSR